MQENVYNNCCFKCGETFVAEGKLNTVYPDCKMDELYQTSVMSNWILAANNDYFSIIEERVNGRKTPIYHICSKRSKDEIGQIKWYGAWRKYCFFPNGETIWDNKCLEKIMDFLQELNTLVSKRTAKNKL